jgi:hypothetical protein
MIFIFYLEVLGGLVITSLEVANFELVLQSQDLAGHGQDSARSRGGQSVDDDWSHFVIEVDGKDLTKYELKERTTNLR